MPEWIHERAKHILAKNPSMPEGMAFGIATQQSHALGKSPKGYGTSEGRHDAKQKFRKPKQMEHTANPGQLETPKLSQVLAKFAFIEALPAITGLASGIGPGREVAGEVAEQIAPKRRERQASQWGRNAALVGVPLGGLAAMALAHRYQLAPRIADFAKRHFEKGLIADPGAEQELINLGVPGVAAIGGSILGGGLSGAAAGGLQHLRHPTPQPAKTAALKPSPMWSRIGGAASKRPVWMAQSGFTPTGFKTPAQRLSKSMDMGTFDSSKGLKPLDLGKMQQAAQQTAETMKMGMTMLAITKTATGQKIPVRSEREDAETGDETDPIFAKESEDYGGHEGFSTNQYSGVMNPPTLPYRSGIPPWQEPPVKTITPQAQPDYTKEGGLLGEAEELAAREHDSKSGIRIPSSVAGLADDAVVMSRRLGGHKKTEEQPEEQDEFKLQLGRPLSPMDQEFYNREPGQPLSAAWHATEANPEVKNLRAEHARNINIGMGLGALGGGALGYHMGHPIWGALAGGMLGMGAGSATRAQQVSDARNRIYAEETAKQAAAGITPAGRLNSTKAIGAPKLTSAPGPSIAQIAKPKGFGTPMSGAKKGNHII